MRTPFEQALTRLDGECWIWIGQLSSAGYPRLRRSHNNGEYIHRLVAGAEAGMHVHHICGTPACVNPDHLQVLTIEEHNRLHGEEHAACPRGHPYTEENVYITPAGGKQCRTCKRVNNGKATERRRNARAI